MSNQISKREDISFYNPEKDMLDQQNLGNSRKPYLTISMLNELKKIRITKKAEALKQSKLLATMYAKSTS